MRLSKHITLALIKEKEEKMKKEAGVSIKMTQICRA